MSFKLQDSLGEVMLTLPRRYDTSFSWTDHSDCTFCGYLKYRVQPKNLKASKETGFIWMNEPQDSIERFTISHSEYFPFHDGSDSLIIFFHKHEKNAILSDNRALRITLDTLEKIRDRYFSVYALESFDSTKRQHSKKLIAATTIRNNLIHFTYELLTKESGPAVDSFISSSQHYLRTIVIEKGK